MVPPVAPEPLTPMAVLLGEYRRWLMVERGLAPATVVGYMRAAESFLRVECGDDVARVAGIGPAGISAFVQRVAEVRQPRSVNEAVVGVRSLLRFFYLTGRIDRPLAQATPARSRCT